MNKVDQVCYHCDAEFTLKWRGHQYDSTEDEDVLEAVQPEHCPFCGHDIDYEEDEEDS